MKAEKIAETQEQVAKRLERAIDERGIDRADITELGKLADIVKDLAIARYNMTVTEAMAEGPMGYEPMDGMGYERRGYRRGGRRGYNANRDSMGRYASRRGYREARYGHEDMIEELREAMSADPQAREEITRELHELLSM